MEPVNWLNLGVAEDGLPTHLPMGCNEKGQGPVADREALTYHCWCGSRDCLLDKALQEAWRSGMRLAIADE